MMVSGVNSFGRLWAPKQSRLYVGRDVLAMPSAKPQKVEPWKKQVVDDVATISKEALAKYQTAMAENGGREYSVKLADGRNVTMRMLGQDQENGGRVIEIQVPGEEEARRYTLSEDTRITFDENGEPQLLSGGAASAGGILRAEGKNEILVNFSSAKVEAGENTTVINFAGEGGEFTSGLNTTYLGSYSGAKFKDGAGTLTFAGVFDNSTLNVGLGQGDFSGVFTKSELNGGALNDNFSGVFNEVKAYGNDGNDKFSGLFIEGSLVDAGGGNDIINGRFIRSDLLAGDGDDSIGDFRLSGDNAQEFQFVGGTIDTGAGNNRIRAAALNSVINMGKGDNRAYGVFQNSTLNNAEGDAKITALLSNRTDYTTGTGQTEMTLATAVHSDITTGEGKSTVNLGVAENQHYSETIDGEHRSLEHLVWDYQYRDAYAFGEVFSNQVNMERGNANLNVSTGENSYAVHARNEEVPTGRLDPLTGLPETEMQRKVGVTEDLAADVSTVRTAVNVRLSSELMLKFQAEDSGNVLNYNAGRGYKAYSYNLGRV